ncbi:hypothetical protein Tco_0664239 [Tanacetum coccineum]
MTQMELPRYVILKDLKTLRDKTSYVMTMTSKLSTYYFLDCQLTSTLSSTNIKLQRKYGIASKNLLKTINDRMLCQWRSRRRACTTGETLLLLAPKTAKNWLLKASEKSPSGSNSASQNLAFLSSENTSGTNEVSTAIGDFGVSTASGINQVPYTPCAHDVAYSFFAQPTTSPQLENEDFQQIDGDDLEELDLRWQVAILTVRVKKFIQRTGRNLDFKEKRPDSHVKSKIECYNYHKKGHFAREWRSGRNQERRSYGDNGRSNAPTNESSSQ